MFRRPFDVDSVDVSAAALINSSNRVFWYELEILTPVFVTALIVCKDFFGLVPVGDNQKELNWALWDALCDERMCLTALKPLNDLTLSVANVEFILIPRAIPETIRHVLGCATFCFAAPVSRSAIPTSFIPVAMKRVLLRVRTVEVNPVGLFKSL